MGAAGPAISNSMTYSGMRSTLHQASEEAAFNTAAQVRPLHLPITEAADNTLAEIAAIGGGWRLDRAGRKR